MGHCTIIYRPVSLWCVEQMSKSIAEAFELPSNHIVPTHGHIVPETDTRPHPPGDRPWPRLSPLNSRGAPPLQIRHLGFTLAVYTGQDEAGLSRGYDVSYDRSEEAAEVETFTEHEGHLTLPELYQQNPSNKYLPRVNKDHEYPVPAYPRPELHVSHLSHSTDLAALQGIQKDGGFRDPSQDPTRSWPGLVWFSLTPTPEDLSAAEGRFMTLVRPGGEEEVWNGHVTPGLLQSFATSPAFSSSSRYGSYRLTFDLSKVLDRYSEQVNPDTMRLLYSWSFSLTRSCSVACRFSPLWVPPRPAGCQVDSSRISSRSRLVTDFTTLTGSPRDAMSLVASAASW
uniref:Uncharacterized protein n=1 Tax=Knipowitschia caucasica TaxID=637954 RepID=A0AAV2J8X6_KNICA